MCMWARGLLGWPARCNGDGLAPCACVNMYIYIYLFCFSILLDGFRDGFQDGFQVRLEDGFQVSSPWATTIIR